MGSFLQGATRRHWLCWVSSIVVHLLLLLGFLANNLTPADRPVLQLQVTRPEVGAELVVIDVSVEELDADDAPLMTDIFGDLSAATIEIESPLGKLASGDNSSGEDNATAGTRAGGGGGAGRANFFGIEAEGERFVYILDSSKSMEAGSGRRMARAIEELLRSVQQLQEGQSFYVLLFSSGTRRMFDEQTTPYWRSATTENKKLLRAWITRTVSPDAGTFPQEAVYLALQLRPSAIFLLTDGDFSHTKRRHRGTAWAMRVKDIVAQVDKNRTPIHTIAFEEQVGKFRLNQLAEQTGGQFQYVQ